MGLISKGKTVLLDTNCFIYYFEDNPNYSSKLENIFIENRYKLILTNYPNLSMVDMDYNIADVSSRLRANYSIKTPDAIILASAIAINVDYVITNDKKLNDIGKKEGIEPINLENTAL